jgi:hypothetical protein
VSGPASPVHCRSVIKQCPPVRRFPSDRAFAKDTCSCRAGGATHRHVVRAAPQDMLSAAISFASARRDRWLPRGPLMMHGQPACGTGRSCKVIMPRPEHGGCKTCAQRCNFVRERSAGPMAATRIVDDARAACFWGRTELQSHLLRPEQVGAVSLVHEETRSEAAVVRLDSSA